MQLAMSLAGKGKYHKDSGPSELCQTVCHTVDQQRAESYLLSNAHVDKRRKHKTGKGRAGSKVQVNRTDERDSACGRYEKKHVQTLGGARKGW